MLRYEEIERDMNQEPFMVYKKNNLLLEKVILDRALSKVQKRRFIHLNMLWWEREAWLYPKTSPRKT